ncbi:MAG: OmpA family protein [Myxococcota bacterium]
MLLLASALAGPCATVEGDHYVTSVPIAFASRAADPTPESLPAAAELACALAEDASRALHIGVHTDSMGSGTYNQALSQKRADAFAAAVVAAGAAPGQVSARGYGEDYPVDSNATAEGRDRNRRVELLTSDPGRPAVAPPPPSEPAPPPRPSPAEVLCGTVRKLLVPPYGEVRTSLLAPATVEAVSACLTGWELDRDGSEAFLVRDGLVVRVRADADGSRVTVQPTP